MTYNTKFEFWDRVITPDRPMIIMQIVRVVIDCSPPYIPDIIYVCQEIDTAKFHKIAENNLRIHPSF